MSDRESFGISHKLVPSIELKHAMLSLSALFIVVRGVNIEAFQVGPLSSRASMF